MTAEDETVTPHPPQTGGASKTGTQTSALECRLCVARAERDAGAIRKKPMPYPEYVGPNQQHADANKAEFLRRQRLGLCYACPGKELNEPRHYNLNGAISIVLAHSGQRSFLLLDGLLLLSLSLRNNHMNIGYCRPALMIRVTSI